jgi:hypothetical protein
MRNATGRILKSSDVKVEGKFTLDVMQIASGSSKQASKPLVEPQVSIVERKSEFSVIEITCSCGEKMKLRCEYAGTKTQQSPTLNEQQKTPEQKK